MTTKEKLLAIAALAEELNLNWEWVDDGCGDGDIPSTSIQVWSPE